MRFLDRRSLISLLKLVLDVVYYGAIALAGLVVLVIVLVAVYRPAETSLGVPVHFDLVPGTYEIVSPSRAETGATLRDAEGELVITGGEPASVAQAFVAALIGLAIVVFMLRQFRGLFRSLKEGAPFVRGNVWRIRALGLVLILGELLRAASVSWSSYRIGRDFSSEDISFRIDFEPSLLLLLTGLLLVALAEVFRQAATMKRDLETAREIQFELVPDERFEREGLLIRSRMRPANTVGGDYYDVIPLENGRLAVVQGDVAGKGLPAAMLMAVLQGSLRTLVTAGFRGARLVGALNDYLEANTPANRMVTLFYAELDVARGAMTYVNAGHNRPFLVRRDGTLERPAGGSTVLGILPHRTFEQSELRLEPGDGLMLFTDGISEAFDPRDNEYGDARVGDYLSSRSRDGSEALVTGLIEDVLAFCRPAAPTDDMTLTWIARR